LVVKPNKLLNTTTHDMEAKRLGESKSVIIRDTRKSTFAGRMLEESMYKPTSGFKKRFFKTVKIFLQGRRAIQQSEYVFRLCRYKARKNVVHILNVMLAHELSTMFFQRKRL